MAKDLPYFKFNVSEYINGNITLEDFYTQGVFINVCAFYWFRSGKVTLTELKRRLPKAKPKAFDTLVKSNLIKVENDILRISFLDEQLNEREHLSLQNSENGKKGGAPKGNTNNRKSTESQPKSSNIEEKREEEKREREETHTHGNGTCFITIAKRYANERVQKIYNLEEYFIYTGQAHSLEESGWNQYAEFIKANSGKVFNEPDHLYNTFRNFCMACTPPARAPNYILNAEVDFQNLTPEAWHDMYKWQLKNDEAFKKHFNGKLSPSQPVGVNDKR